MEMDSYEPTEFNSGSQMLSSQNMRIDLIKKHSFQHWM